MSIYIGFAEYKQGRDKVEELIETMASRYAPEERAKYPYPHCFLLLGGPEEGFHRVDLWLKGLGYVFLPPSAEVFPKGIYFKFSDPERELAAFYKILNPWVRYNAKCSIKHIKKLLDGQKQVMPEFSDAGGRFSCTSFVLWALDMLGAPHRTSDLIEWLRANSDYFKEINGQYGACDGVIWNPRLPGGR